MLVAGENCTQARLDHRDYICQSCHRDYQRPYQRDRVRTRLGWVEGKPPARPAYMLAGEKHGRWTVLEDAPKAAVKVLCRCECGTERPVNAQTVREGVSRSCGCLRVETTRRTSTTHGLSKHPLYHTWACMIDRCGNPRNIAYANYGGRGITVCERWRGPGGLANFIADMRAKPAPGHTLERVDVNGNYGPDNCVWATMAEQGANRRRYITNAEYDALLAENERLRAQLAQLTKGSV